jgi:hypothetical protein
MAAEMTLIGESAFGGNARDADLRTKEQSCHRDPVAELVGLRRHPIAILNARRV